MSERDEDEVPANPAAADADQHAHGTEGSPTTRLMDLAAASIEAGNPSAIDGIAKAIAALNGSVGSPNWHQFVPKFDMPATMPVLLAISNNQQGKQWLVMTAPSTTALRKQRRN
jgi:hypothetical protein